MIEIALVMILLGIYPFIVRMNVFPTPKGSLEYLAHPLGDANGDFYFYEKIKLLIPLAILLLLILLFKREKIKTRYYIGLGIYFVGITISTLMSPFLSIAVKGGGNRYEGYYVLLAYGILTLVLINLNMKDERRIRWIINTLFGGGILVSIAGFTEFVGRSIYKIPFLANWALPREEWLSQAAYPSGGYVSFIEVVKRSPAFHNVSSTLGNSNYGGSFAALILGVVVVLFLGETRVKKKLLLLLTYISIYTLLLISRSRAGMVAFQGGMIFLFLIKGRDLKSHLKDLALIIFVSGCVFLGLNYLSGGEIGKRLVKDEGAGSRYRELVSHGKQAVLGMYDGNLNMRVTDGKLEFSDTEGRRLEPKEPGNTINFTDERYEEISLEKDMRYPEVYHLRLGRESSYPLVVRGGTFSTIGREGTLEEIVSPPRIEALDRIQKKGSMRVYIWSRSIHLFKKTGLFGYGPDTYPIIYPQNDYFGKFIAYGTPYMFISKPHNMYLQMALNTGLISLFGFLLVVIPYLLQSFMVQRQSEEESELEKISLGIFIGIFSYLVAGLFNDSAVSVAPNFWMMLGLGIAVNTKILREKKQMKVERIKNRI